MIRPKKKNGLFSLLCEKNKVGRSEILFKFFKIFLSPCFEGEGGKLFYLCVSVFLFFKNFLS